MMQIINKINSLKIYNKNKNFNRKLYKKNNNKFHQLKNK